MRAGMVIVGIVGIIAACATESSEPQALAGDVPPLAGQTWTIAGYDGEPVDMPDAEGRAAHVTFGNGTMEGSVGCSRFVGAALSGADWYAGGLMNLQIDVCEGAQFDARQPKITGLLTQRAQMREENGQVVLVHEGHELALEPAGACTGCMDNDRGEPQGEWVFLALNNEGMYDADNRYTLTLDEGRVSVRPGCNSGSGSYTLNDGAIVMRDLTLTEMGCTSYDQTMERGFLAMTGEPIQFTMMDDKLMLANAGGSAILGPADGQYR